MKPLLDNQASAIDKLRKYKVGALFMDTGSGKTRTLIELANSVSDIDFILYVAPCAAINTPDNIPSIIDEVDKWGGFDHPVEYIGVESIGQSDRIYLETISRLQSARNPLIIVDESIKIKNWEAQRTKRLLYLSEFAEYKLIANATPITKNIMDIWAQFEFLSPKILKMHHAQFLSTFCKKTVIVKRQRHSVHRIEYISGFANIDYLYNLIGCFVYESSLEHNNPTEYIEVGYNLEESLMSAYNDTKVKYLSDEYLIRFSNRIFFAITQKMQHSYCCSNAKLLAVKKHIRDEQRTVIYCKYIRSQEFCKKHFPNALVLSYQKNALSLNLQHDYSYMLFWDKIWDYYLVKHAKGRIDRIGQKNPIVYINVTGDAGLERLIDKNVSKKTSQADYLKLVSLEQLKNDL